MATLYIGAERERASVAGGAAAVPALGGVTLPLRARSYYQRIEAYALRIRGSRDVSEIIGLLDKALSETHELAEHEELQLAMDRIAHAESEIEALKSELEQATNLVQLDQLTGTLNRRGLEETFKREAARSDRQSTPLCLAMLDLDNFKRVNDRYGHPSGDDTLAHFCRVVRSSLRPNDTLARYGGEEFIVLLADTDEAAAFNTLTRLQRIVTQRPVALDGDMVALTFSAGIARRALAESMADVINRADAALLGAKREGKNRVMFEAR